MTRVIKVGGRVQSHTALAGAVAALWSASPGGCCIVHGGGEEISDLQRKLGAAPVFTGGRRVTTVADLDIVRMALSGTANKRLVSRLVAAGVAAVGLSGEDGGLIEATQLDPALGAVGTPRRVHVPLLRHLLAGGFLPVISPLSRAAGRGEPPALNVNGDDAAAAIAIALGARELLLLSDVPGVLRAGSVLAEVDADEAGRMLSNGDAGGGMAAKLEAALRAAAGGVGRVRIGDLSALADPAAGTTVTLTRTYA